MLSFGKYAVGFGMLALGNCRCAVVPRLSSAPRAADPAKAKARKAQRDARKTTRKNRKRGRG